MSCHGTPGNRAVTSMVCALTHTPSDEVSRRFHLLKRERGGEAPTQEQALDWLDRQALAVRQEDGFSAFRRARLEEYITAARADVTAGNVPDAATWHAWTELRADCDAAHAHAWLAQQAGMRVPLSEQEPKEVDEQLGNLWTRVYEQQQRRNALQGDLRRQEQNLRTGRYGARPEDIERTKERIRQAEKAIDGLFDEMAPFEAEYVRRGRWARYYRVVNNGTAHVHSSMSCHTCYPTTQYAWLPSLSGKGEDEAVDDYGSEMCSVCFPAALQHPSYRTRGRIAEEAAARRAQEQAARQAARDAKGIKNPDGTELTLRGDGYPERVKTEATAKRLLMDRLVDLASDYSADGIAERVAEQARNYERYGGTSREPGEYRAILEQQAAIKAAHAEQLLAAVAHKNGMSVADLKAQMEPKVAAKVRKLARDRARWREQNPQYFE